MDTYTTVHANDTVVETVRVDPPPPPSAPPGAGGGFFLQSPPPPPPSPPGTVEFRSYNIPANNTAQFMSVVAYYGHGDSAVRSEPRYVRSTNSSLTIGTGQVMQLILIARFTAGKLKYLQWADLGCSGCGGPNDARCMQVGGATALACAGSATLTQNNETCYTYTYSNLTTTSGNMTNTTQGDPTSPCSSGVYMGFAGTDRYGKPLKTGGQMELLRKYSVSKLGTRALGYARQAASYAKEQVSSSVPTSTANTQLGRRR